MYLHILDIEYAPSNRSKWSDGVKTVFTASLDSKGRNVLVYKTHQSRGLSKLTTAIDRGTRRLRHCATAELVVGPSFLPEGQRFFCGLTREDRGRHSRLVVRAFLRSLKLRYRGGHPRVGSDQVGQLRLAALRQIGCGNCMHASGLTACMQETSPSQTNCATACIPG